MSTDSGSRTLQPAPSQFATDPPTQCDSCARTRNELLALESERGMPYKSKYDIIAFPGLSQRVEDVEAIKAQESVETGEWQPLQDLPTVS